MQLGDRGGGRQILRRWDARVGVDQVVAQLATNPPQQIRFFLAEGRGMCRSERDVVVEPGMPLATRYQELRQLLRPHPLAIDLDLG